MLDLLLNGGSRRVLFDGYKISYEAAGAAKPWTRLSGITLSRWTESGELLIRTEAISSSGIPQMTSDELVVSKVFVDQSPGSSQGCTHYWQGSKERRLLSSPITWCTRRSLKLYLYHQWSRGKPTYRRIRPRYERCLPFLWNALSAPSVRIQSKPQSNR